MGSKVFACFARNKKGEGSSGERLGEKIGYGFVCLLFILGF
jgi:hypothetical protein